MNRFPFSKTRPMQIVAGLFLSVVMALAVMWGYGLSDLPTKEEREMKLPGDDLLAGDRTVRIQGAVTIDAPREKVWPYLAQIGQRKAGFYSFGLLERLATFHIYNTFRIVDEWQHLDKGDYVFYHQNGVGSEVQDVAWGEYFTMMSDSRRPSTHQGSIAWKPPWFRIWWFFRLKPCPRLLIFSEDIRQFHRKYAMCRACSTDPVSMIRIMRRSWDRSLPNGRWKWLQPGDTT